MIIASKNHLKGTVPFRSIFGALKAAGLFVFFKFVIRNGIIYKENHGLHRGGRPAPAPYRRHSLYMR